MHGVLEDRDARRPDAVKPDVRVRHRRKVTPKTITTLPGSVIYKRACYRTREAGAAKVPIDDGLGLVRRRAFRPTPAACRCPSTG